MTSTSGNGSVPPEGFREQIAELGIIFEAGDIERLGQFLDILLETAKQFNLTAIREPDEAWNRHILDSMSLLPVLSGLEAKSVIDVGSGGGLPGIPLALVQPDVEFTLLEATGKKAKFLKETATTLGATNITVINERAEVCGQGPLRESFDVVLARAVGPLPVLLELTAPLARIQGHILAIKGEKADVEIAAARDALFALNCQVVDSHRTSTGTVVSILKERRTAKRYPRRPGEPKRAPIGSGIGEAHKTPKDPGC